MRFLEQSSKGSHRLALDDMDLGEKNMEFENCMLHRQEFTLREYMAWCEHKSSVARKIAVCYRYMLDKQSIMFADSVLMRGIGQFEECVRNEWTTMGDFDEEQTSRPKRHFPYPGPSSDGDYEDAEPYRPKRRWPTRRPDSEEDYIYGDHSGESDVFDEDRYEKDDDMFPRDEDSRERDERTENRDDNSSPEDESTFSGKWSYSGMDNTYYYPRREKGLGNDTTAQNHTAGDKEQSKPPTTLAGVKGAATKKAAQVTTSKPPKK